MTLPILMLLTFSMWTIALLIFTVGVYRWGSVLTGKAQISDYRADKVEGSEFYKRAMRAHANCIENLPIFGAVVFAAYASNVTSHSIDVMSMIVVIARIVQSLIHVIFVQTNIISFLRFCAFFTQVVCFVGIALIVLTHSASNFV